MNVEVRCRFDIVRRGFPHEDVVTTNAAESQVTTSPREDDSSPPMLPPSVEGSPLSVSALVVEDDPMCSAIIADMLSRELWEPIGRVRPRAVSTIAEAMRALSSRHALDDGVSTHLVLLDIELPHGNGDTAIPAMRALLGQDAVIVCVSGHTQPELIRRCIMLGADDYLQKPFARNSLSRIWALWVSKNRKAVFGPRPMRVPESPLNNDGPDGLHLAMDDALEALAKQTLDS